jgi:hypothetical protein
MAWYFDWIVAPKRSLRIVGSMSFCRREPFDENVGDTDMAERLVDVLNGNGSLIHTYPVTVWELGNDVADAEYLTKGLEAAASGHLVPDADLAGLEARIHVARGGQKATSCDDLQSGSETKIGLEQQVREPAYFLWEEDGRPEGRARNTGSKREVRKVVRTSTGGCFRPSRRCNSFVVGKNIGISAVGSNPAIQRCFGLVTVPFLHSYTLLPTEAHMSDKAKKVRTLKIRRPDRTQRPGTVLSQPDLKSSPQHRSKDTSPRGPDLT